MPSILQSWRNLSSRSALVSRRKNKLRDDDHRGKKFGLLLRIPLCPMRKIIREVDFPLSSWGQGRKASSTRPCSIKFKDWRLRVEKQMAETKLNLFPRQHQLTDSPRYCSLVLRIFDLQKLNNRNYYYP